MQQFHGFSFSSDLVYDLNKALWGREVGEREGGGMILQLNHFDCLIFNEQMHTLE